MISSKNMPKLAQVAAGIEKVSVFKQARIFRSTIYAEFNDYQTSLYLIKISQNYMIIMNSIALEHCTIDTYACCI